MYYEQRGTLHFYKFDSITEAAEAAVAACKPYLGRPWDALQATHFTGREFKTYQKVVGALGQRWEEGMQTYERMIEKLRGRHLAPPRSLKRRGAWSEDGGDELCLDRLRSRQPYWRTTVRDHRPGPLSVTIITDTATLCNVAHMNILWRGAAAVCLTELLEEAGYRVELWQAQHISRAFQYQKGSLGTASLIKAPADPLDVSSLINATSGWMERTIFFAILSLVSQPDDGDGGPADITALQDLITNDEQVIFSREIWSEYAAVKWVEQQLEKFESGQFAANT